VAGVGIAAVPVLRHHYRRIAAQNRKPLEEGAMTQPQFVDQPLVGFGYDYWFLCSGCGNRVAVTAADYWLQSSMQAPYPVCGCGTTVDISRAHPTLRDPDDIAMQDGSVVSRYWYHTSRIGPMRPPTAPTSQNPRFCSAASGAARP
jgi:hypothetical protein